jgi:hypothetical protein
MYFPVISSRGVRLGSFVPGSESTWVRSSDWMVMDRGKPKCSKKNLPNASSLRTDPTRITWDWAQVPEVICLRLYLTYISKNLFIKCSKTSVFFEYIWDGIAQSVHRLATGWTTEEVGVRVSVWPKIFSSPIRLDRPYSMGTGDSFPGGVKWPRREIDHSFPGNTESSRNVDLYIHSTLRLHGIVLN